MRANTSLMGHILGSHPEINGYYEMHMSYRDKSDLEKQKQLYSEKESLKKGSKYLFDKLLHNDYELSLANLHLKNSKILVSIRSAEQSIKSILNLFQKKNTGHPYANVENATQYYIHRIKQIAIFCEQHKKCYYYYDAELIREAPEKLLAVMQKWLVLNSSLKEEYQIFSMTGKPRAGDSSTNMHQGNIIRQQTNYSDIHIPSQFLQQAVKEMNKYKLLIENYATESIITAI